MATKLSDAKAAAAAKKRSPFLVELYRSAVGKKYVMAITGIIGLGYVFAHMVGNLKIYQSPEEFNAYADFLGKLLYPIAPAYGVLLIMRIVLVIALVLHVFAAWQLTLMNRQSRPEAYRAKRDYVAADFAARTMRWTGVIVLLFIVYHLADFTWEFANPAPEGATLYEMVIASFSNPLISAFYLVANAVLGVHLYHGVWSLFQSMGWSSRRFNHWRRALAIGFTVVVVGGNLSFPIAVLTGVVS